MRSRRLSAMAISLTGMLMAFGIAQAAAAATCGIIGSASAAPAIYDPFSPTGLATTRVTLRLDRVNQDKGEKTDTVNFYLAADTPGANGTVVVPRSTNGSVNVEGLNYNIFYDFGQKPSQIGPTTISPTSAMPFLKIYFTGNNKDSDFVVIDFDVTLPPNLDITAINNLALDAYFACSTTGGGKQSQQTGSITNAISFPITVLSALQASFAGSALDFGEIGDISTAQVQAAPATYVTQPVNYVRVQSSGPYEIAVTSANGYVMTPNGTATQNASQRVGYRLRFLGQTRSTADTSQIRTVCPRAGVGAAAEDRLYLQAQLAEGGTGKTVSPAYRDTLTVTLSPKIAGTAPTSGGECTNLQGQF